MKKYFLVSGITLTLFVSTNLTLAQQQKVQTISKPVSESNGSFIILTAGDQVLNFTSNAILGGDQMVIGVTYKPGPSAPTSIKKDISYDAYLGKRTTVSGLFAKDETYAVLVISWALTTSGPNAVKRWIKDAIAYYRDQPYISGFAVQKEGEINIDKRIVLFNQASFFQKDDGETFSGLFASWYNKDTRNVFFLFVMGKLETIDFIRENTLPKLIFITEPLPHDPSKGGGDPLSGLMGGSNKPRDGKTVYIPFPK